MKVKFYMDSCVNIHSKREEVFDTAVDLGIPEGIWEKYSEDDKYEYVQDWLNEHLDYGYIELD